MRDLDELLRAVSAAWREAGLDLAIEVTAPFSATLPGRQPELFPAYVRGFDAKGGTVCGLDQRHDWATLKAFAHAHERYSSLLSDSYAEYDRELFIDTLNDWGWHVPDAAPPAWYTGKPWS